MEEEAKTSAVRAGVQQEAYGIVESGKALRMHPRALEWPSRRWRTGSKAKGAGKFKEVSGKGRVTTEQMEIDKTDFDIPTVRTATR